MPGSDVSVKVANSRHASGRLLRVGAVSFLNAAPLVDGLADERRIELTSAVPSRLANMLADGLLDVALLPTIELQRLRPSPVVLPAGCIASDGETLTVRVFSRVPPEDIRRLHVDGDSRTSVVLAAVLWRECFGRSLELLPLETVLAGDEEPPEAMLLIGDKVVTDPPVGYDRTLDLGQAWHTLTGRPFVFALWAARQRLQRHPMELQALTSILAAARARGVARAAEIARRVSPAHGWPADLAVRYLTEHMQYEFTDEHRKGMEAFFSLAHRHRLVGRVVALRHMALD